MASIPPPTITGYMPEHLLDVAAISGTNGVAVGAHNGYSALSGYTAPLYKTNAVNGMPSLVFRSDGTNLTTTFAKLFPSGPSDPNGFPDGITVITVVKPINITQLGNGFPFFMRGVVGLSAPGGEAGCFGLNELDGATSSQLVVPHGPGYGWTPQNSAASYPEGEWVVCGFWASNAEAGTFKGQVRDRHGDAPNPERPLWITSLAWGADVQIGGRQLDGEIAYGVVFDRVLTSEEREGAAVWLLERFGLSTRSIAWDCFSGASGKDIFCGATESSTGRAAYLKSVTGSIAWSKNGTPQTPIAPIYRSWDADNEKCCNLFALRLPTTLLNTDVVTVTIDPDVVTTTLGVSERLTGEPVVNNVGTAAILTDVLPAVRTMKAGVNFNSQGNYTYPYTSYRNVWKTGYISPSGDTVIDSNQIVQDSGSGVTYLIRSHEFGNPFPATPGVQFGRYRLRWKGPVGSRLALGTVYGDDETDVTHVAGMDTFDLGPTAYSETFYDVTAIEGSTGRRAMFNIRQFGPGPITEEWVGLEGYDPDADVHFDDLIAEKLAGFGSVRFMDTMVTNSTGVGDTAANIANAADLPHPSDSRYTVAKTRVLPIASITSYEGPPFLASGVFQFWLLTTSSPHGLADGQRGRVTSSSPVNVTLAGGYTHDLRDDYGDTYSHKVISPTQIAWRTGAPGGGTGHRTATVPFAGTGATLNLPLFGAMPVERPVQLCEQAGVPWCHFNLSHALTDAAVTAIAERVLAVMPPTMKIRIEESNEPWNYFFGQFAYFALKSYAISPGTDSHLRGYVQRSFEVLALFRAAFVAAGRPASDVELALNVQYVSTAMSAAYAAAAIADGNGSVEGVSVFVAPYMPAHPLGRLPGVDYSGWTVDRMMDYHEAWSKNYTPCELIPQHRAALDAAGMTHWGLGTYEGQQGFVGMSDAIVPGGPWGGVAGDANYEAQNRENVALKLHPRMYGITLKRYKDLDEAGAAFNHTYCFGHTLSYEFQGVSRSNYGEWNGLTAKIGRGDGSNGGEDNRPYITDGAGLPKMPVTFNLEHPQATLAIDWGAPETTVTATIGNVTSPRLTAVTSVVISFTESVIGVVPGSFSLSRDGVPVDFTGVITGSGNSRTLGGLAAVTNEPGSYLLTLVASGSGITSADGLRPVVTNAAKSWVRSADPPVPTAGRGFTRFRRRIF